MQTKLEYSYSRISDYKARRTNEICEAIAFYISCYNRCSIKIIIEGKEILEIAREKANDNKTKA